MARKGRPRAVVQAAEASKKHDPKECADLRKFIDKEVAEDMQDVKDTLAAMDADCERKLKECQDLWIQRTNLVPSCLGEMRYDAFVNEYNCDIQAVFNAQPDPDEAAKAMERAQQHVPMSSSQDGAPGNSVTKYASTKADDVADARKFTRGEMGATPGQAAAPFGNSFCTPLNVNNSNPLGIFTMDGRVISEEDCQQWWVVPPKARPLPGSIQRIKEEDVTPGPLPPVTQSSGVMTRRKAAKVKTTAGVPSLPPNPRLAIQPTPGAANPPEVHFIVKNNILYKSYIYMEQVPWSALTDTPDERG